MSTEGRRLAALREYHRARPIATRNKLSEALDRIQHGKTVVLESGAKLTKTNLCIEAGVSLHTLLVKDKGTKKRRYADVIARFDKLVAAKRAANRSGDAKDEKIAELRAAYTSATEDNANMALEIDRLGMELLKEKEEVARLSSLEEQNAELREEIRRMQPPPGLRLASRKGDKKGGKK